MTFRVVKPGFTVLFMIVFGATIVLPVIMFLWTSVWYGLFFLAIWAMGYALIINQCLIKRIEIDKSGVAYKTLTKNYKMSWDEIKIVGFGYLPIKAPGAKPWIYFAADGVSCPVLNAAMVNDKYFMVNYRQKIVDEIRKYWLKEIDGLDSESDFEKRFKPKRRLT